MDGTVDEVEEIFSLLHLAVRRVRREVMAELRPLGMTPGQHRLLRVLHRADGPLRLSEVAARLDIAPRSATAVVDEAEAGGFVRRTPDTADRRAVLVQLTDEGGAVLDRAVTARRRRASELFGDLDADQRRQLAALLRIVVGADVDEG